MQFLRFLLFAIITLSLSACIFEKDASKNEKSALEDKTSIQPIKELKEEEEEPLATNSDYVPQDGHTAIMFNAMALYKNNELVLEDKYFNVKYYSHISELPIQFGYQHTEVGPYIKTEHFKRYSEDQIERTSVQYSTLTPPDELLISHYLKRQIYSTIEFNQQTATSSQESNGFMTQYTNEEQLFDEYTGNSVGFSYSKSKITALNSEPLTIRSGTYDAVRASVQSEFKVIMNDSISNTWTEVSEGLMWFDINTGAVLKTTSTITATNVDYTDDIYTTRFYSEFVSSDEYPETTINMSSSKNNTDESFKNLAIQEVIKNNQVMTNNFSARLTTGAHLIKLPL